METKGAVVHFKSSYNALRCGEPYQGTKWTSSIKHVTCFECAKYEISKRIIELQDCAEQSGLGWQSCLVNADITRKNFENGWSLGTIVRDKRVKDFVDEAMRRF